MNDSFGWADIVEIQHLINRIAATADTASDIQEYLDLLTEDVLFEFAAVPTVGLAAHRYVGHDEVRAGVVERRSAGVQGPGSATLHIVSDVSVEDHTSHTAAVHAAWQYFGVRNSLPTLLTMGLYKNMVQRVNDRWLLARREVVVFG